VQTCALPISTFLSGIESINGSKNLSGGSVLSVLGGIQLDLRHAQLTENGAVLNVTTILGGVELIVPEDVHVEIKGTPILGGWENKTNTYGMEKNKTLYINGVALLGRSEEHTSELQSRFDIVCRLLLE